MAELKFVSIHTVTVSFHGGSSCAAVFLDAGIAEEFCDAVDVSGGDAPCYNYEEEVGIQHGNDMFFIDCYGNVLKVKPLTEMPTGDRKALLKVVKGSVTPLDPEGENGRHFGPVFQIEKKPILERVTLEDEKNS